MMAQLIEVLARGVLVHGDKVLLAAPVAETHAFLPGGHVEFGESAPAALAREMREELGVAVTVGAFLGAVEHTFTSGGQRSAEINLLFDMASEQLRSDTAPVSREGHIAFFWQPLTDLAVVHLEPHVLREQLPRWLAARRESCWASTLEQGR